MKPGISPLLALFALSVLAGCTSSSTPIGGKPNKNMVMSWVSLSPSATEVLNATGNLTRMIGRTSSCNYPTPNSNVKVVVNGTTPDFETIKALNPQRVLLEKDLYSDAVIQKLKDLGLQLVILDTDTPETYESTLREIGILSGAESPTSSYLDTVYGAYSTFAASVGNHKIAVLIGEPTTGLMAQGTNTLLANYTKKAGATFVGPESGKFETVSAEQLITWAPTIIITTKNNAAKIAADPKLKAVPAMSKGSLLEVDPDILLRNGGRVDDLLEGLAIGIGRLDARKGN
jgi:ABC-type Fe3+-hydroxamate transport system substrate-binding protein